MSSVLLFQRYFYRQSVNIPAGLTLERHCRLHGVTRPWVNGLARLLADRRLKKGDLAELARVRPGTVSAVANSPKSPDIATLQKLADGFTKHDRAKTPSAPAVELWEFFVNDEQAHILRTASHTRQQLAKQEDLTALVIRELAPAVASAIAKVTAVPPPIGSDLLPASATSDQVGHPPAVEDPSSAARGRLRPRRSA